MAKKKRTTAMRRAAAKAAWEKRRLAASLTSGASPTKTTASASLPVDADSPYVALQFELAAAMYDATDGKGKERHANNKPFDRQPIAEIGRVVGPAFNTGQAMKKAGEATQLFQRGEHHRAIHELQGAIVYLASAIMLMREAI